MGENETTGGPEQAKNKKRKSVRKGVVNEMKEQVCKSEGRKYERQEGRSKRSDGVGSELLPNVTTAHQPLECQRCSSRD